MDDEEDINSTWETIRENIKISDKESRLLWIEEAWAMVWQSMLKIVRSEETSYIAVVTGSKQNKWG
jgi:hypothetical protein